MYPCVFTALTAPAYAASGEQPVQPSSSTSATGAESSRVAGNPPAAAHSAHAAYAADAAHAAHAAVRADPGDFDFLHGQWLVENRRSEEPLHLAPGGGAFDSVHICRPLASGGHLEEATTDDGTAGAVLRLFDAHAHGGHWTIHRIAPAHGTLEGPLLGGFENGIGTFIGEGTLGGRPVLVRETWVRVEDKPRCELAVSPDGGQTWSTRWIRDFIRVDWPH